MNSEAIQDHDNLAEQMLVQHNNRGIHTIEGDVVAVELKVEVKATTHWNQRDNDIAESIEAEIN